MNQLTEEQVREYLPIVKDRIISLIGNGTPDWEDLTQDIMFSMVKAVKVFRDDSDIKTLLYVVTMRRYYDYLRKIYREKSIICFEQYTIAVEDLRREGRSETRIDKINFLLKNSNLTREEKILLEAVKNTLLSRRLN